MSLRLIRVVDGEAHSQEIHQKPRRYRDEGLVLVGDNILWVPFVSECLVSRVLSLVQIIFSRISVYVCIADSLGRQRSGLPLEKEQAALLPTVKDLNSLGFRFLLYHTNPL